MPKKFRKLRALMVENGDNQDSLARELLICKSSVGLKLSGRNAWTLDEMWKIMEIYRVPADHMHEVFPKDGV